MIERYTIGGTDYDFDCEVEDICVCGQPFHVGRLIAGSARLPSIIHGEPHCKDFKARDVIDFMRWHRMVKYEVSA